MVSLISRFIFIFRDSYETQKNKYLDNKTFSLLLKKIIICYTLKEFTIYNISFTIYQKIIFYGGNLETDILFSLLSFTAGAFLHPLDFQKKVNI